MSSPTQDLTKPPKTSSPKSESITGIVERITYHTDQRSEKQKTMVIQ